jgi:hypothetical protein
MRESRVTPPVTGIPSGRAGPNAGARRVARPLLAACRLLLGAGLLAAASCSAEVPTERSDLPVVEGSWAYSASAIRIIGRSPGSVCEITGMTLEIGPWRPTGFFGRSSGGFMSCTQELEPMSGALPSYPIRRGGAVLNFIAFDIATPDWRHDGTISGDTMSGAFNLQQGSIRMEGSFRAVRLRSGTASAGPAASLSPGATSLAR